MRAEPGRQCVKLTQKLPLSCYRWVHDEPDQEEQTVLQEVLEECLLTARESTFIPVDGAGRGGQTPRRGQTPRVSQITLPDMPPPGGGIPGGQTPRVSQLITQPDREVGAGTAGTACA
jgi:hypothetical protein